MGNTNTPKIVLKEAEGYILSWTETKKMAKNRQKSIKSNTRSFNLMKNKETKVVH